MKAIPPDLKPARMIRHTRELRRLVDELRREPLLAVDTESNSLFAYYERVCLIQLSTRAQDVLIDPLAVDDMAPLGDLLADPAIEIVFHAAEYDIISLKRDFHYEFAAIFDTMLAARICGWPSYGLGNILNEHFGVQVNKKFQRADWSARPLPAEQARYAQMDTHYLPVLRDRLRAELVERERLDEALEIFADLATLPPAERRFNPDGFWPLVQMHNLSRSQAGLLRELYLLREELARRHNLPPFKVWGDDALVTLVRLAPRRLEDLYSIKGLGPSQLHRYGQDIVQAVERGRRVGPLHPPRPAHTADPLVYLRYEALREWRKRRAVERGVESDVIIPRDTLWVLAHRAPARLEDLDDIPGLGPWRRAEYGAELITVLEQAAAPSSDANPALDERESE